ncbi:MAG: DUF2064 domain-containing protein [Pseudomonadota bacterium]|nr:DUF2064 domain-containing protein [Pseudomonadota bacterium]
MKSIVHILSKNPDLCECKTRLRDFLSHKERVYLSKTMLTMLCSEMNKINVNKLLHLYPSNQGKFSKKISQRFNISTTRQMSGCLSDKIFSAFDNTDESYQKRILVGSDIPSLSKHDIEYSIHYLDMFDVVIGPSNDGGFYLVGTKNNSHSIFKNLKLNKISKQDIFNLCSEKKLSFKTLRVLKDIDVPEDLLFL